MPNDVRAACLAAVIVSLGAGFLAAAGILLAPPIKSNCCPTTPACANASEVTSDTVVDIATIHPQKAASEPVGAMQSELDLDDASSSKAGPCATFWTGVVTLPAAIGL